LSSFSFFFIDLTDWKTIFVKIIQFYSTVHCSVTTKAKVIASFLKALEKSIFHPCEPNMAGFVKYGLDLYFVFIFHVLFLIYSLISIRQNYNSDMLANIWHEIVGWFLTISQDLRNMITKFFLFWSSYQCRSILWSQKTRTGKNWGGGNHKSTNNAMSNDGSSIEIIDNSHGD
jgi:hypothetical protein